MPTRPRVLLLGDSIRLSYQPLVTQLLRAEADVVGPDENGQFALYTLASLDQWIERLGKPDLVHWNNGLHDVGHFPTRAPAQFPIDIYRANIEFILRRLLDLGTKVIWAATTPVHPNKASPSGDWPWQPEDIPRYNRAAAEVMKRHRIPISDLYALVAKDPDRYISDDGVHLTEAGIAACAEAVAGAIRSHLP